MRYAIIADIHGNGDAFQAVLEHIASVGGVEEFYFLGDVCGYGAEPVKCINLLLAQKCTCIAGNHDLAAIGKVSTSKFNPYAAEAARWTASILSEAEKDFLRGLPLSLVTGDFTLVHGSPRNPIWEYIVSASVAQKSLKYFETGICFIGHSHLPLVFKSIGDSVEQVALDGSSSVTLKGARFMVNPGSVGQPRDKDPRASYAIYDDETGRVTLHRVEYDIKKSADKIIKAGLPKFFAERLSNGV